MTSACDHVLSTPELLEAILIHLTPLHTLLHAQLVSHTFHKTITSSPTIQQLLFFRPNPSQGPKEWTVNPLLRKHFLPFFVVPGGLFRTARTFGALQLMDWTKSETRRSAFLRTGASWRNMLLMQPSPKELQVIKWCHAMGGDTISKKTITFDDTPSGHVTMGRVWDIAEFFLRDKFADHGSFALSFIDKNTTEPPYLGLRLRWSASCVISWAGTPVALKSEAAEFSRDLDWDPRDDDGCRGFRDDEAYTSDLTGEKGGVEGEEWRMWVKEKGPILYPENMEWDENEIRDFLAEVK